MTEISIIEYQGRTYDFAYLEEMLSKVSKAAEGATHKPQPDRAAIVSHDPRKLKCILDHAAQRGLTVDQISPAIFAERFDIFTESKWTYAVISVDDCGGVGKIFDTLRQFRDTYPQTPVILVSADFSKDDLSSERLPLADVSLKLPLVSGRLQESIDAALLNNVRWQMRVQELARIEEPALDCEDQAYDAIPIASAA
jgi:hypothetical protein